MRIFLLSATFFLLRFQSAFAHHPWEGVSLTEWHQGLISGFAHPVLGPDHLAFLVALAVLCAVCFLDSKALAVFVPATVAGVFVRLFIDGRLIEVPFYETAVSLTIVAAGVLIFLGGLSYKTAAFFTALFGILHGFAYGGGIVGAETSPLVFYLLGLAVVQTALVFAVAFFISKSARAFSGGSLLPAGFSKIAGALFFVAGAVMSLSTASGLF